MTSTHTPIIDTQTWEKAQKIPDARGESAAHRARTLAEITTHITDVITSDTHHQTKALVTQVTITGPDQLTPVFRVPQPHTNRAATAQRAENGPEGRGPLND